IVSGLSQLDQKLTQAIEAYRLDEASSHLYQFIWGQYCDWYLEFAKPILDGADGAVKAETQATCAWVLTQLCRMLHPFMPFITEELWQHMTDGKAGLLMASSWPQVRGLSDERAD